MVVNTATNLDVSAIERWKDNLRRLHSDIPSMDQLRTTRSHRKEIGQEMVGLTGRFLDGEIGIDEFRLSFHRNTLRKWDSFGVGGASGGMLLNIAVKYVQDKAELTKRLRAVIKAPTDLDSGQKALSEYVSYLRTRITSNELTANMAGINRVPFFVSVFWYVQRPNQWPIFYPTTRKVLSDDNLFQTTGDVVSDYFKFFAVHDALRNALGIDAFELEYLSIWLTR